MIWVVRMRMAAVGGLMMLALVPATAGAETGLAFLDTRPVVIDLERTPAFRSRADLGRLPIAEKAFDRSQFPLPVWRVTVFQGQAGGPHALVLHVLFEPANAVVVAAEPGEPVATGQVASFVIALARAVPGSGELVVTSSDGAVARREIRVERVASAQGRSPAALNFSGTRVAPLWGPVVVPAVEVPDAPGAASAPVKLGTVTSPSGDVGEVVRSDDTFQVDGIDSAGEFTGEVTLLPDSPGDVTAVTVRVRDAAGWPLAVLIIGLVAVQRLERYQKRVRPRRSLTLRLADLKDRARATQRRLGRRLRICADQAGGDLLLDRLAADALNAWDRAGDEEERSAWEAGGAAYLRISAMVGMFETLAESYESLVSAQSRVLENCRPGDRLNAQRAFDESPVGDALRPTDFTSSEDMTYRASLLSDARAHLARFADLYEALEQLGDEASDEVRAKARALRRKLTSIRGDLGPISEEAAALVKEWKPKPEEEDPADAPALAGAPAAAAEVDPPPGPPVPPDAALPLDLPAAGTRRGRGLIALGAAAVVVVVVATLAGGRFMSSGPQDAAPATPPGRSVVEPIEDAPVRAPTRLPRNYPSTDPEGGTVLFGLVLPVVLGSATLAALAWLIKVWGRRSRPRADEFDSTRLRRLVASQDRGFAIASGLFVVASGMSILYFPDATFGSAGDYLTVALWGAAVGEGIQIARRLIPLAT